MQKPLKRIKSILIGWHDGLTGTPHQLLRGNVSGLRGDVIGLTGDVEQYIQEDTQE